MTIHFHKYHGTGNDFILLDNREGDIALSTKQIAGLCHRRFGIGADGLMLLEETEGYQFKMVYFNADGRESSMCGNGGRCITAFAHKLGLVQDDVLFVAIDGAHTAHIYKNGDVALHMQDVADISVQEGYYLLDTGSPHYVAEVADTAAIDVLSLGRRIRYDERFAPGGVNVNFVQRTGSGLYVRTYERGVEDETLSCGTGVTACAIAMATNTGSQTTAITTPGGQLQVSFDKPDESKATNVTLTGNAVLVYEGVINL